MQSKVKGGQHKAALESLVATFTQNLLKLNKKMTKTVKLSLFNNVCDICY